MKLYLISDNVDTLTGMRLAGIEGVVVHGSRELKEAVEKACADYINPDLGVLLIQMGYGTFGFRLDVRVGIKSLSDLLAARSAAVKAVAGRSWLARW